MCPALVAARPHPDCPLVVAYGLGVDSTAMLVEFARRGVRPDLILFADTGGEKPETYAFLPAVQRFLALVGFPLVTTVRYQPKTARYHTLEGQCLMTRMLPSLAFGGRSCSLKYKATPQDRFVRSWPPAQQCWARGGRVVKAIGFDAGCGDRRRANHAGRKADPRYEYWYPLQDWGLDRERCQEVITSVGLPVPPKSACFFCPASKKAEILWLAEEHPDLLERALQLERNARGRLRTVRGLGRSFSWEAFLREVNDLPLFRDRDD
jgi:hypothetical protein